MSRADELQKEVYIGDAVYASFDGHQIWLRVSNGIETTNRVALDPHVFQSLLDYRKDLYAKIDQMNEAPEQEPLPTFGEPPNGDTPF